MRNSTESPLFSGLSCSATIAQSERRLGVQCKSLISLFSFSQISGLRLIKVNSTLNLVDNFRPVQALGKRAVTVSFKAEATTEGSSGIPTEPGHAVAVKMTTALLLLMLSVAFLLN